MKKVLLVTAALFGWAVYAHASEAYSDPSDLRTPGVTVSSSAVTIKSSDGSLFLGDPYGMKAPGTTHRMSSVNTVVQDTNPVGMRASGSTNGSSSGRLASKTAK
jgi:hypothetical protein